MSDDEVFKDVVGSLISDPPWDPQYCDDCEHRVKHHKSSGCEKCNCPRRLARSDDGGRW